MTTDIFKRLLRQFLQSIIFVILISCNDNGNEANESQMKKIHERDSLEIAKRDLLAKYENAMHVGEMVFKNSCAVCHCSTLGTCEPGDMPHLRNLFNRIPQDSINYIVEYIKDSKKLKDHGDKFALQLEQSYPDDFEHLFKNKLTDSETKNVILYLWLPCQTRQ